MDALHVTTYIIASNQYRQGISGKEVAFCEHISYFYTTCVYVQYQSVLSLDQRTILYFYFPECSVVRLQAM